MSTPEIVRQILDLARWAPSGDNTQPWRFEIIDPLHVIVHGLDTREHCVYDLDGHPSQIAIGGLIETISIAASAHGLRLTTSRRLESAETKPVFELGFSADSSITRDPLVESIERRSVQRRPLQTRALSDDERSRLETCMGEGFTIVWLASLGERLRTAKLLFHSAKLRLVMPEAYLVHKQIIEWNAQFSIDRVPDQALGTDPLTTRLMHFVMHSWSRVEIFNRYLAGTWTPRIQLDFIPSVACAAHFLLKATTPARTIDDYVAAGRAMQRFWLTATHLGLMLQPEVTPLVFSRYAREGLRFAADPKHLAMATQVRDQMVNLVGEPAAVCAVFMGRVGHGQAPKSRSLRQPLDALIVAQRE